MSSSKSFNPLYLEILGRRNGEAIIIRTDRQDGNNVGWMIKTNDTSNMPGSYSKSWVDSFNEKIEFNRLDKKLKKILLDIINTNFHSIEAVHIKRHLKIITEKINITVTGNVIDIEDVITFNMRDIKILKYAKDTIELVFKDGLIENIYNWDDTKIVLKEAFTKIGKQYI